MEERIYTINLYKEWKKVHIWKRTKKCIKAIREFIAKHMKANVEDVKIDMWVNIEIWKNSIKNPPRKIRIKAIKDEKGIVKVELLEKPKKLLKLEKKKLSEEKRKTEKESKEINIEEGRKESKDNK